MCTINESRGRSFGPGGCQVPCGSGICGETRTLEIINEFRMLYEEKMNQIDTCGGGDCLTEKVKLQQEWIGDLSQQNQMLVSAVEELEHEATERVSLLEEKLQQSAQCLCEVMKRYREYDVTNDLLAEPLQKVFCLENDKKNLLEFIRRIREENRWDIDGLKFFEISYQDLLGSKSEDDSSGTESKDEYINTSVTKEQDKVKYSEGTIRELEEKLGHYNSFGNVESLASDLKCKMEECECLRKSMDETKHALVAEIASKHDIIVQLKADCQQLEERCIQADKHTTFRDDIIKELRKEIKQLKQQGRHELSRENKSLRDKLRSMENKMKLLKINCKHCSNRHVPEKLSKSCKNNQTICEKPYFIQELSSLGNLDANDHNRLTSGLKEEIIVLNDHIEAKDAQLREQLDLIRVLVSTLFTTDQGLKFLEERVASIQLADATQKAETAQFKLQITESRNGSLDSTIADNKIQIANLDKQFYEFLKDKDELKQKLKCKDNKCKQLCEDNGKLARENEEIKGEIEKLKKCNILFKHEWKCVEKELEDMKTQTVNCNCIIEQLKTEKEIVMTEMVALNQENRNLLKTIDLLKKRIDHTRQLTHDEIIQLNTTIDELQSNIHKTKQVQEEEENRYREIITQLTKNIQELSQESKDIEEKYAKSAKVCKICKGRAKVQFQENSEVQACVVSEVADCQMELIQSKDEIIKVQSNTLNLLQLELQNMKDQDSQLRLDQENKYHEIQDLKNKIDQLENALEDSEAKGENLQLAVDLYINSINVLEASEEKYKIEIDQQKSTIFNLQNVLVATKQELDEIRHKSEENEQEQHSLISSLNVFMSEAKCEKQNLTKQYECISDEYEHLQDLNFDLEVEHCNSLQDVHLLENQLFKYQTLLKSSEEENVHCKHHLKKLLKQKKCYEEVISYFKHEMGLMSEQLINLQEILTLSNESTQEETCKLMQALVNVQALNEKLSTQLIAAEQKVALENQMNLLQEAKINELQEMISDKELNLTRHDDAISKIRQTLHSSLKQNEELRGTIVALNDTICQLQCAVNLYEEENCKCKEATQICQSQITACMNKLQKLKNTLEKKAGDLLKLEMAYNHQTRYLKSTQIELKEMKERQCDKQARLKNSLEEVKAKLAKSEEAYSSLCNEFSKVQTQLASLMKKENTKEMEVKRYRKIVADLKNTLIELNKSLTNRDLQKGICNNEECRKNMELPEEARNEEVCLNCPCEVEFYQNIVESLKKSVMDLKKRLTDTQKKNVRLEEDSKRKEAMLTELSKSQSQKDREFNDLRQKLMTKLGNVQPEEIRYQEMEKQFQRELASIRNELEVKTMQLDDVKKGALEINSSRCVQLACAQEEVNTLKEDLNKILRKHCALNAENEKLHSQSANMQATVNALEEKSQLLRGQLEQYLEELQNVQTEKDTLLQKNAQLLSELRHIQYACTESNKQNRPNHSPTKPIKITRFATPETAQGAQPTCQSPWSLGSQGTASYDDLLTPSRSPSPSPSQQQCDWYSANFRNESEDEEDEDWVSKVEHLAAQVRKTNKMWKNKMGHSDYTVSKDTKK